VALFGLKSFGFWFLDMDYIIENLLKSLVICMKRATTIEE
jgi:hypothetical protein